MDTGEVFTRVWAAFDAGELMTACAWCRRVRIDGAWVLPPPSALAAIDARLAFSHSICAQCVEGYLPSLAATRRGGGQRTADARAPTGVSGASPPPATTREQPAL